ncbi:hypothetical protein M9Y10_038333 [Tritrichomonas musculus]|uniref:Protein kinase domain-containing protein n=1 Tax=Tritrichomonas musculus TaxID=1915356 RepID=A0ABR2K843_9EUKA
MSSKEPHMNHETGKKKKHGIITYPDTIGPYTIRKTIGEGAFSIVKLVFHELYYKFYACKIVPIAMLKERDLYQRFELEIRISQLMRHPGVAAITDVLKDENNFYIIMEYYPNGSLLDYIVGKTRLDEQESKGLIYQIFDALEYIHLQNVSHRDLKPENIMIDINGHIRISDFGLSRFVGPDHLAKTPCGSPCYVSPECVSGKKYDGLISDVWSCGVILYAMVTGMLPWTKRKMNELFHQIRHGEYKIPSYVSAQCANLIQMLLTVDPQKRITLEEAKHHTWFNFGTISENEKKMIINYEIPEKFLKSASERIDSDSAIQGVPYLSTRKVDIYFRPDIDYDFDRQFNDIKNLHAIVNSSNQSKCDVSSPNLEYDDAVKMLKVNDTVKTRRRVAFNKDQSNRNLGLKNTFKSIVFYSTGTLIEPSKPFPSEVTDSILVKEKSHNVFTKINKINDTNEENEIKSSDGENEQRAQGEPKIVLQGLKSEKLHRRIY